MSFTCGTPVCTVVTALLLLACAGAMLIVLHVLIAWGYIASHGLPWAMPLRDTLRLARYVLGRVWAGRGHEQIMGLVLLYPLLLAWSLVIPAFSLYAILAAADVGSLLVSAVLFALWGVASYLYGIRLGRTLSHLGLLLRAGEDVLARCEPALTAVMERVPVLRGQTAYIFAPPWGGFLSLYFAPSGIVVQVRWPEGDKDER